MARSIRSSRPSSLRPARYRSTPCRIKSAIDLSVAAESRRRARVAGPSTVPVSESCQLVRIVAIMPVCWGVQECGHSGHWGSKLARAEGHSPRRKPCGNREVHEAPVRGGRLRRRDLPPPPGARSLTPHSHASRRGLLSCALRAGESPRVAHPVCWRARSWRGLGNKKGERWTLHRSPRSNRRQPLPYGRGSETRHGALCRTSAWGRRMRRLAQAKACATTELAPTASP